MERRLKQKVDKVGLLLGLLYGYIPVCCLKAATPLTLSGRLNWGLILGLRTHAFWQKPKEETLNRNASTQRISGRNHFELETLHLEDKAGEEHLSRAFYVPFYSNKAKDKQEKQVPHTYDLIQARNFVWKRQNERKRRYTSSDDKFYRGSTVCSFLFAFQFR